MYKRGDVVALGLDGPREAVVEGVKEVGRYFLLYEIREVGRIPNGGIVTTQLVIPLNSHPSLFLRILAVIFMALIPWLFRSSAVFGKLGGGSKMEGKLGRSFGDLVSKV
jgi:hypothetical protein